MEYILDGYNLIKSSFLRNYERRSVDYARQALFNMLSDYRRKHPSVKFTAVFDGFPASLEILKDKKIRTLFSGDVTADELIREMLEKSPENNRFKTVVSDDRGVQDCGRLFGSGVLPVSGFLEIVYPQAVKPKARLKNAQKDVSEVNKMSIEKELRDFYKYSTPHPNPLPQGERNKR
ncbi:MAG: NYN domain-containing protein [Candidatus Omnitrophica bacterium]|nr:NYN domain-containing protein [Candidatus Omnitrophota bacterium]